jgi:hypothetical protein
MTDVPPSIGDPLGELERAYIAEFLLRHGHTLTTVHDLPTAAAHDLLKAASIYASGRLTEVESRSHYVDDMHGGAAVAATRPSNPPGRRE